MGIDQKENKVVRKNGVFRSKIGRRLLGIILIIVLLPLMLLGYFSYSKSFDILKNSFETTTVQNVEAVSGGVEEFFSGLEHNVDALASSQILKELAKEHEQGTKVESLGTDILDNTQKTNQDIRYTYVGTANKRFYIYPVVEDLPEGYDPTIRDWYINAVNHKGEVVWTEPYPVANDSKELVTTVSKAIIDNNGKVTGVVAVDISLNYLTQKLSTTTIGDNGYLSIIDKTGSIVTNKKTEEIGKDISSEDFWKTINSKPEGFSPFNYEGEEKYMAFMTDRVTGWKILGIIEKSDLLDDTDSIKIYIMVILGIAALFGILASYFIARWIGKPISKLRDSFEIASTGDLTVETSIESKDEFGDLGNNFNTMMKNIRNLIRTVIDNSEEVDNASQVLSATVEEITAQTQTINSSTQEIAAGMEEASATTEEVSASGTEVVRATNQLANKTIEGNKAVKEINNRANEIKKKAIESTELAKSIYADRQSGIKKSIEAGKVVLEIEKMADIIADIADQTSLLALNASIEAARAGEHGRGFAVVAEEIRKLAEESTNTISEIQNVVKKVMNSFSDLSEQANGVLSFIDEKVTEDYKVLEEAGVQYQNDAQFMGHLFGELAASTDQISVSIDQINQAIEQVASATEQSAANSSEISGNTTEVARAVEEMATVAQNQADLAQKLNALVNKFKV